MIAKKDRVVAAFDQARNYDDHASVQRWTADALADRIVGLALGASPRVLEIGCGTGYLAAAIGDRMQGADWLMTDISPAMVARSRAGFGETRAFRYRQLDGEHPDLPPDEAPFDLICSNLAVQWFTELEGGLARLFRLLRPGGQLIVSTLAEGTFVEWRRANAALGMTAGTPSFPTRRALAAMRLDGQAGMVESLMKIQKHTSGLAFLRAVRSIGAGTPVSNHKPLSPAQLRKVIARFEEDGAQASYSIAICLFRRPEAER
jgi:malonyl-CoA O-methyltransferase